MTKEKIPAKAAKTGKNILAGFAKALAGQAGVKDIRGHGMMIGIELDRPCAELVGIAAQAGLLINVTANSVVRLLPPLTMSDSEAKQLVSRLSQVIGDFLNTKREDAA